MIFSPVMDKFFEPSDYSALFINSEAPPDKYEPLNYYNYSEDSEHRLSFFRLFCLTYIQEKDGFSVKHSMLKWLPIQVKSHCQQAMKNYIDGAKALTEFLIPS